VIFLDAVLLFTHIAEIILVATIVSALMKKLKQPSLLAYIIAGVILGPVVLGSFDLQSIGIPFNIGISEVTEEIRLLSLLGASLLLFSIGIETSLQRLFKVGNQIIFATILQVLLVIASTFILTVPLGLLNFEQALFVGTIIAFSSTMIVVKLLSDSNELNSLQGRLMISILLLQDLLVIFVVPLLTNISEIGNIMLLLSLIGKSLFLILVAFVLNRFVFPKLFKVAAQEQELFLLSSIATAFVFIGLAVLLKMPEPVGAFIGGLALSTLPYNLEIYSKIRALRDFFLVIFFVSLGIQLSFGFSSLSLLLMIAISLLVFVIKPIIFFCIALILGFGSKTGVKLGLGLASVSEFGFEIVAIAAMTVMVSGVFVFSKDLASFIIAVIAASMIITPYLMQSSSRVANYFYELAKRLPKGFRQEFFKRKLEELEKIPSKRELKDHIIIIGGGTVGRGLAKELIKENQVIVVDYDPEVVAQGQKDGFPYVYGTSENEALWDKLDLFDAKLLVVTILNHNEAINIVKQAKNACPKLKIFSIAHYFSDTLDFYNAGVDFVSMPFVMGSNIFLENIYNFIQTNKVSSIQNFNGIYFNYLKQQIEEEKKYRK
jgi:monovalent cation:H+ antiporter-2, CPA2 family